MQQKYYWIFGIVIVLIVIGVIIAINLPSNLLQESLVSRLAPYDSVTMEATVLSITQGGDERPDDWGHIRIDSISNYVRNPEANYEPLTESIVGTEIFIRFSYSSRPAKVKYITVPRGPIGPGPEAPKEDLPFSGFQAIENGLYVYALYSGGSLTKEHEVVLHGLKEGDKIRFTIYYGYGTFLNIGEYEIIP